MIARRFVAMTVTFAVSIVAVVHADGEESPVQAAPVEVFPLPANTVFERHVVGETGTTTAAGERLIYSNTLGTFAFAAGAGRLVSDDISTTVPNNCKLRRYEFPVVGKVDPNGMGGPYTVDFAIYSTCPLSVSSTIRPSLIIPGTVGQAVFPDDAPRLISFVTAADTYLPANFWFSVKFSRNNAGVVMGTPALSGFSGDQFDYPQFPCSANFGGFPDDPQASFNLEIYGDAECANAFAGYKNHIPNNNKFNPGANVWFADDIQLGVDECQMIGYEVAVKGVGFYEFEIRNNCDGPLIGGTQKYFTIPSGTETRIARFNFAQPIALPQNLWFSARVNNSTGGVVVTGQQACIGRTEDLISVIGEDGACNLIRIPGSGIHSAFDLTITCAGSPPVGACCDMALTDANGEAVCREVPRMNCPSPWPQWSSTLQPSWVEGASCDPDPFPFPCGAAACCRPDQVCENLTQNECNSVPPLDGPRQWQRGLYCGVDDQVCPWVPCLSRLGDCLATHDAPGCWPSDCCVDVCDADSFCCLVEWDRLCVETANMLCTGLHDHDECSNRYAGYAALSVEADSVTLFSNVGATQNELDPGFCCRSDTPGATGFGTTWFKFVATDTSARVSACDSDPANNSLLQVFAAGDPTTEETACATLSMIACSDDVEGCGGGTHGRICVQSLVPGQTYYVMVAAKTLETEGLYELEIRSPCFEEPIWNPDDCNANTLPDGCELGSGTASDCNLNRILDECDITNESSTDCNSNRAPDECDLAENSSGDCNNNRIPDECEQDCNDNHVPDDCDLADGTSRDCQPNGSPDECDVSSGASVDCNDDLIPDECTDYRQTLRPDTPSYSFGESISVEGDLLLVGGPGAAYVFRRIGPLWKQEEKLMSPVPNASFGSSVALANGQAFVLGHPPSSSPDAIWGAVFVFSHDSKGWHHDATLVVDDVEPKRSLWLVSAHQDHVAVSAFWSGISIPEATPAAIVYVFRRDGTTWKQEAKLPPLAGGFGTAIALHGDCAAIGAYGDSLNGIEKAGSVYLYRRNGALWLFEARITSPEPQEYGYFGSALALRDGLLVVAGYTGSNCPEARCQEAVVFRHEGNAWVLDGRVADPVRGLWPGSVDFIHNGMMVMSPPVRADDPTVGYVYQRLVSGNWNRIAVLRSPELHSGDLFLTAVRGATDSAIVSIWPLWSGSPTSYVNIFAVAGSDCNGNHVADSCDLRDGTSGDCNANDIPDECDALPPFDSDFDGGVDLMDLAGFQRCFTGPGPVKLAPCCKMFDAEPDGDVDLTDFVAFRGAFVGP